MRHFRSGLTEFVAVSILSLAVGDADCDARVGVENNVLLQLARNSSTRAALLDRGDVGSKYNLSSMPLPFASAVGLDNQSLPLVANATPKAIESVLPLDAARRRLWEIKGGAKSAGELVMLSLLFLTAQAVLVVIMGHLYLECAMDVLPEVHQSKRGLDFSKWRSSLLSGWNKDSDICLASCCCPCARWADSLQKVGIMSFWPAMWLTACGLMLTELTYGLCWVPMIFVLLHFRQQLRRVFKMENQTWAVCVSDALSLTFCLPCVVAQDARQVEEACAAGDAAVVPHWAV